MPRACHVNVMQADISIAIRLIYLENEVRHFLCVRHRPDEAETRRAPVSPCTDYPSSSSDPRDETGSPLGE